jgi:hypothetical protein
VYSIGRSLKGSDRSVGYEASRDCSEHKVNNSIVLLDVVFVSLFVCLIVCCFTHVILKFVCVMVMSFSEMFLFLVKYKILSFFV